MNTQQIYEQIPDKYKENYLEGYYQRKDVQNVPCLETKVFKDKVINNCLNEDWCFFHYIDYGNPDMEQVKLDTCMEILNEKSTK